MNEKIVQKNVLGEKLETCSNDPLTGWFRDGCCNTDEIDHGVHTVCAKVTNEFLKWSKNAGNDLITPSPEYGFEGLKAGDHWCLCAPRWKQAYEDAMAPMVCLEATEIGALNVIGIERLMQHSFKGNNRD